MKKQAIALFAAIILFSPMTKAQVISTVIGTGVAGFSGDGGPATAANVNKPSAPHFDAAGNLFFCDYSNNRVRSVSPAGIIVTIAGTGASGSAGDGGAATAAQLNKPVEMVQDALGNFYVVEFEGHRVRKISTSGIISTFAGTGMAGYSGDGGPAIFANINGPESIAVDVAGNVYVSEGLGHRVRKVNTSGIISTIAGNGVPASGADGIAATASSLNYPYGIAVDGGDILIADQLNSRIRKVDAAGIITTIAGTFTSGFSGDGGPAISAKLYNPTSIHRDASGNLFITDKLNERVRKVSPSGIISTVCGNGIAAFSGDGGPATAAQVYWPEHTTTDLSGRLYIADNLNHRIRIISQPHSIEFINGKVQTITICVGESDVIKSINTMLAVADSVSGETLYWTVVTTPMHGSLIANSTELSTGIVVTPAGLTYTATGGYTGTDAFKVSVFNGSVADTVTVNVVINPEPNAGVIAGIDSVCPGQSVILSETASGGIWSCSDMLVTAVDFSGMITGIIPGYDTILYTVTNSCGTVSTLFPFAVRSYSACHTMVGQLSQPEGMNIAINPVPNNGIFTLQITSSKSSHPAVAEVFDVLGKKVGYFELLTNQSKEVAINLVPGIYVVSAHDGDSNSKAVFTVK